MKTINELEICDIFSLRVKSAPYMVIRITSVHIECRSLKGNKIHIFIKNGRRIYKRENWASYTEAKFFKPE